MVTYIVMNLIFPSPYIIYAVGFGLFIIPFLIPIDILIAGILSGVISKFTDNDNCRVIFAIGLFSIALSYIFIGSFLGIIGIILFIAKFREYVYDIDTQKYSIFGLICSAISVIMTAIEIYFFSLFIV